MEFLWLLKTAAVLIFVFAKIFRAYSEHDNVNFKKEKNQFLVVDEMICYREIGHTYIKDLKS